MKKLDHDIQEQEEELTTPPKLCLLVTRPYTAPEAPTPPPRTAASVPFQWEEAPGKPRPCHTRSEPAGRGGGVSRALELPPRLSFMENNHNKVSVSPTTVLDGPYIGRAVSFTMSHRSSTRDTEESSSFGSTRWLKKKKSNRVKREGSFDFSSWSVDGTSKVKIMRVRRTGSFLSLSRGTSHLWANIYESFKQVVPWRCRQETQGKQN
ncbi:uncharacterized protein At4g00950-like [Lotus japonicus]|uniref:uncharacterized protein At4g00950-like n=1 Tax=Lotus japonicus TaxID=34305 RepID=UPI002586F36D|nr:uncharacterized protein At4g00950-like [Lotus japonicus]